MGNVHNYPQKPTSNFMFLRGQATLYNVGFWLYSQNMLDFHLIDSNHVAIPVYTRLFCIESAAKHLASCTWVYIKYYVYIYIIYIYNIYNIYIYIFKVTPFLKSSSDPSWDKQQIFINFPWGNGCMYPLSFSGSKASLTTSATMWVGLKSKRAGSSQSSN